MALNKEVGVGDLVLLDEIGENSAYETIKKRYNADMIYSYIGDVVISVNPYKKIDIFTKNHIEDYKGRYIYERPPHIYALADGTFRGMMKDKVNHCVIISGESGAGKTEASKIIMQYVSEISATKSLTKIKDELLGSNPILEAFGNAKTLRNDNSSRFGKYMEIQFDVSGAPVGGQITIYLLEKSRVVGRAKGERSFHVFYGLLTDDKRIKQYGLEKDPNAYTYLKNSECFKVDTINDTADWKEMTKSLNILKFTEEDQTLVFEIVAAVLRLGNLTFKVDADTKAGQMETVHVANIDELKKCAALLHVDQSLLHNSLIYRSISTGARRRQSNIGVPLDLVAANYCRDALAKALYERLFLWIVEKINTEIQSNVRDTVSLGLLDIYGFEIFEKNSMEQFCINLCNEKLQQVFIELTLKSEQEEYVREGIEWTPVKYFDNKTICDLIEKKPVGIISFMDEACLMASSTDMTILEKLNANFKTHAHYESFETTKSKAIGTTEFRLKHYAGDVTYDVTGFIDKNKDTLFKDVQDLMSTSDHRLIAQLFPPVSDSKKRPETAASQFRTAMGKLIATLLKCTPHYVRCIKPNDSKKPNLMDEERTRHQIRYLGLVENIRVRRAGFANRQEYERFFRRYKVTAKTTFPRWKGNEIDGSKEIIRFHNIPKEQFRLGKTKVFIKDPKTLFYFEEKRDSMIPYVCTQIQKIFRAWSVRTWYRRTRAAMRIQAEWRAYLQREIYKMVKAAVRIQAQFRGYRRRIRWQRQKGVLRITLYWHKHQCRIYIRRLLKAFENVKSDPGLGKYTAWPAVPSVVKGAEPLLKKIHLWWRANRLRKMIKDEDRPELIQKFTTYDIFHGKKPWLPSRKFEADYMDKSENPGQKKYIDTMQKMFLKGGDSVVLFSDTVNKINHHQKPQLRVLVATDSNIYKQDPKSYSMTKGGVHLATITGILVSPYNDSFCLVKSKAPHPDVLVDLGINGVERVSEFVTVLVLQCKQAYGIDVQVTVTDNWAYNNSRSASSGGKEMNVRFVQDNSIKQAAFIKGKATAHEVHYPPS